MISVTTLLAMLMIIIVLMVFPAALGALTLVYLVRAKKAPADTSNRINHIRLWWFALTRPEQFTPQFPWLTHDEWDNMNPSSTESGAA